jgi:hypothetical protein
MIYWQNINWYKLFESQVDDSVKILNVHALWLTIIYTTDYNMQRSVYKIRHCSIFPSIEKIVNLNVHQQKTN